MNNYIELLVTCGYLGKVKYCPGTLGSILAATIGLLMYTCCPMRYHYTFSIVLLVFLILIFVIGSWCSNIYMQHYSVLDPKEIIIDELVGQLISIDLCMLLMTYNSVYSNIDSSPTFKLIVHYIGSLIHSWSSYDNYHSLYYLHLSITISLIFISLATFRFFDILKPWPINLIDNNWHDGVGVMLDDIVAALMSSMTVYVFLKL